MFLQDSFFLRQLEIVVLEVYKGEIFFFALIKKHIIRDRGVGSLKDNSPFSSTMLNHRLLGVTKTQTFYAFILGKKLFLVTNL